jgi:hypothetical protein
MKDLPSVLGVGAGLDTSLVCHVMYYYYDFMFMPLRFVKMGNLGIDVQVL